jgi:precorrin-2 dehydrogenase/sirohydrochlorin ferrochelatase
MLTPCLQNLAEAGRIGHINADYREDQLTGAFLVIGATDQPDVNAQISREARAKGILINIVDDPLECDFILPALLERGDLVIAILTGGSSPALAKKLRMDLEAHFGPEYETLLTIMGAVRQKILAKGLPSEENKKVFEAMIQSDLLTKIKEKRWDDIKRFIKETTGEEIEVGA